MAGLSYTVKVAVLEIAYTAVSYLEAVSRRGMGKVVLLDEGYRKATQRRIPGGAYSKYSAPHHDNVILFFSQKR
jgi:hypothetical protein